MKILITGASGFVGGNFLKRFSKRDDLEIHGISRRAMPWKNYSQVDLSKGLEINFKPDVVIHAAAHVSPWGSKQTFVDKNITATENVVRFCKKNDFPKLIYISSSSVYYQNEHQLNITEQSPIGPSFINEYSASKYAGEQLVRNYEGKHVILRPRAIFGPGDTVLFPRLMKAAKKGRLPLFKTPDPVIGDLIYIDCLTDYMLRAAQDNSILGDYNLTNNEPVEIQNLLLAVLTRLNLPLPQKSINAGSAMIMAGAIEFFYRMLKINSEPPITRYGISVLTYSKTFDVSKMLAHFGPPSMSIKQGMEHFIQWQLNNA